MTEWYCFKCKEKMANAELEGTYLDIVDFFPGIKCPKCGVEWLNEEQGLEQNKKEEELEAKV